MNYFSQKTRAVAFALAMLLLLSIYNSPIHVCADTQTGIVTANGLNVRTEPNTTSAIQVTIPKNQEVTILASITNSENQVWYQITTNYKQASYSGYVSADYITITGTTPTETTIDPSISTTESTTQSSETTTAVSTTTEATTTQEATTTETAVPKGTPSGFYFQYAKLKKKTYIYKKRSSKSKKKSKLKKGTMVYVGQAQKIGRTTWYYVATKGLKTKTNGYIIGSKLKFYKLTTKKKNRYKVCITNQKCNIYQTANGTGARLGTINRKKDVIMLATLTVGPQKWAKILTSIGTGYVPYSWITPTISTTASTLNSKGTVKKNSAIRKVSSLLAKNLLTVKKGKSVTVLGRLTVNHVPWYKVKYKYKKKTYTGYIRTSSIKLTSDDADFETLLSEFPASYQGAIRALHDIHSNWVFKAVTTNLNWADAIKGEAVSGRNTIQSNCPKGGAQNAYSAPLSYLSTAAGDYDWLNNTYAVKDGTNWYTANDQVIQYYMDPRNFLNEKGIFQFESLKYEENQNEDVVQTMLNNTFMSGSYNVTDIATNQLATGTYSSAFMDAATISGVSPYYLVSRVKNEVGSKGSNSTSGTYKGYAGYYNFFNIGANDSSTGNAVGNGLAWAKQGTTYNRPWTTPYKSIVGGAQYIATQYINVGQDTMYLQKFNVVGDNLFYHQYMTNVMAASSYSISNYNTYNNNKLLDGAFTFYIPFYTNMPETACALPASAGNPNGYLKSLSISDTATGTNINMNATFTYNNGAYTATVANNVSTISVTATAISTTANIVGTGAYTIEPGETKTITVTSTAQNGTPFIYTITITRKAS